MANCTAERKQNRERNPGRTYLAEAEETAERKQKEPTNQAVTRPDRRFLPAVQKTEQLVFWFGILRPYKPAQNTQKRRCDGFDGRTRERVRENRNALRRALKRE